MLILSHARLLSLPTVTQVLSVVASCLGLFAFVRYMDSRWAYIPYVFSITAAIAAAAFILSRRPIFSVFAAATFTVMQGLASYVKHHLNGMALHVYDLLFTARDGDLFVFLVEYYPMLGLAALVAIGLAVTGLVVIYRLERPVWMAPPLRLSLLPLAIALSSATYPRAQTFDSDYLPFTAGYNASALYFSLGHIRNLTGPAPIREHFMSTKPTEDLAAAPVCGRTDDKSDLFLVLSESQAPAAIGPEIALPDDVRASFRSGDGRVRALHVETFGAGTWMTNFSVLTGLSTADFGWQAPYVNAFMEGRVRHSLPRLLADCGYRTVALMTLKYRSVNEGPFLKSLGFETVYDADAMKLGSFGTRDSDYFNFVEKLVADHRKTDGRPLFVAMQTMFTHGPFTARLPAAQDVGSAPLSSDAELDEYARRVVVSRRDMTAFLEGRRRDHGPRGAIVAEFGDHQATATKRFVDPDNLGRETTDFRAKMYETFFAVHGFGAEVDYAKLGDRIDAAYLPARILAATNLPKSAVFDDLAALSQRCEGRMHLCLERGAVNQHLAARHQAGFLVVD
ncbi:phosphoglycerol transferase MdoB-like AlkP superfamily enzyme [Rhizobium sp. SG_E_25_P2]|uniref:sulfatase-like hydrolase/transferase n=1 Tax=Rhizobium sp. SG_E_25_P2 TaxID=2879942 RepID=UPI002474B9FC|nr:sulfatase-like hydrolase/transferase [Rhizobium sp. SG_E_25_P2]MDH6266687.1 phosphoglycerol transferase MdoB-like AlkP superfamily enzyme [Rhizobium sp. SG_E_25_P2]